MVWGSHQRILLTKIVPTRTGQGVTCASLWEEELRQRPWVQGAKEAEAALAAGVLRGRGADGVSDTRTPLMLLFWKPPDRSRPPWKAAHYGRVSYTH